MSTIYDVANVKGFIRMCNDGWLQGWHERNGGNLTYRMTLSTASALLRSMIRATAGALSGAWPMAQSRLPSFPATL